MDLLADENVETEWIQALRDDGHDIVRVVDAEELGVSATDSDVLTVATRLDRVLLTADQSDFADPPLDDHAGIVIVADVTRTGGGFAALSAESRTLSLTSRTRLPMSVIGSNGASDGTTTSRGRPDSP